MAQKHTAPIKPSRLLIGYNGLVREFYENSQNCTWRIAELAEYTDRWELLKDRIELYCEQNDIDAESLQIYQNTVYFHDSLESEVSINTHKDSITFDFDDDFVEQGDEFILESFNEEHNYNMTIFDGDEDEDDEDEDDEDEDDEDEDDEDEDEEDED